MNRVYLSDSIIHNQFPDLGVVRCVPVVKCHTDMTTGALLGINDILSLLLVYRDWLFRYYVAA